MKILMRNKVHMKKITNVKDNDNLADLSMHLYLLLFFCLAKSRRPFLQHLYNHPINDTIIIRVPYNIIWTRYKLL